MLLASASFATMAAMIKAIGPGLPVTQLVFLRCTIAAPFLLGVLLHRRQPLVVRARKLLLARTLLGVAAMHCFFYALTHMELASCIFIGRSQPLILALLAPLFLREKAPSVAWLAILTGMAGVALVVNPSAQWSLAALVALTGAFLSACVHMLIRKLNRTDRPMVIVFNFTVLTGLATGIWSLPGFEMLDGHQWLLITGVAVFASFGQLLMTSAYRHDRAPVVAAASYSSVVLSVIYGYFFWKEIPAPTAWLGGLLIIGGGLLLVRSRYRVSEPTGIIEASLYREEKMGDGNCFDPMNDRLARDIRNGLARAFVPSLESGELGPVESLAGRLLEGPGVSEGHRDYVQDRLARFRSVQEELAAEGPADHFGRALVLWDHELFFEVHELLEGLWLKASGGRKLALQALIRAAGYFILLGVGNRKGAEKMAERALPVLEDHRRDLPPFNGFDLLLETLRDKRDRPPKLQ